LFCGGVKGFYITLVITVNATVSMLGNEKKDIMGCFYFLFTFYSFFFFFNEKKEAIVFVCWSIFSSARPGWGRAVVFYVGSIYWALVFFFLICSIVMMAILAVFGGGSE